MARRPETRRARPVRASTVLLGVLALAVNLRAALAGYPPLLETVRAELGISAGAAGLVQASAVLMMAAGSFAGSALGARFGRERALGASVGLVAVGSLIRGIAALTALVVGSLLIGLGIGLAGVLLTGVVKEHLSRRAGAATGGYVVAMLIGASLASGLAVPLAVGLGAWSLSLAVLAVPALLAVGVWTPIAYRMPADRKAERAPLPWRRRFGRLMACYQAGTSLLFYGWLTWLSAYYQSHGWSRQRAGLLLALWSISQIPAALFAPMLAERRCRWRFWAGLTLACGTFGTLGALLRPIPPLVGPSLWVVLIAIALGAGFPLGLTVIAWRTPDGAASAATSGLALGIGYTVAGIGPLVMGLLIDVTGGYPAALAVLLLAATVQAIAIIKIGDEPRPGRAQPTGLASATGAGGPRRGSGVQD